MVPSLKGGIESFVKHIASRHCFTAYYLPGFSNEKTLLRHDLKLPRVAHFSSAKYMFHKP